MIVKTEKSKKLYMCHLLLGLLKIVTLIMVVNF